MSFEINNSGFVQTSVILLYVAWASVPVHAQEAHSKSPERDLIRPRWTVSLPTASDSSTAAPACRILTQRNLLILESREEVRVLDLRTGANPWDTEQTNAGRGEIVRAESVLSRGDISGTILANTWVGWINGGLLALDLNAEGKVLWFRRIEELSGNELASYRPAGVPVQAGDGLLAPLVSNAPASQSMLVKMNPLGEIQWRQVVDTPVEEDAENRSSTLLVSEQARSAFWLLNGGQLVSLHLDFGSIRWKRDLIPSAETPISGETEGSLFLAGDQLYVTCGTTLTRVHTLNGEMVWQHDFLIPAGRISGEADGIVILAGSGLRGVHHRTGLIRWQTGRAEMKGPRPLAALLHRGTVLAAIGGELWSIDPKTGEVIERMPVPGLPEDAAELQMPTGDVLIVSSPGRVAAFDFQLEK